MLTPLRVKVSIAFALNSSHPKRDENEYDAHRDTPNRKDPFVKFVLTFEKKDER
jgi:hypothetical protein